MGRPQPGFKGDEQSRTKRSPADLCDAATRHFSSKRYGPAEDRCRKALALDPKHADSLHLLGLIYWQTNRLDMAIDLIGWAIKCNPNNHEYFLNLGEVFQQQSKLDDAGKSFEIAIKLAPNLAVGWIKLGKLLLIQRRYSEVLLAFENATTLDSNKAEASGLSARVLFELGRHEDALAKCDLSLAISSDQPQILGVKGDCLHKLGRIAEAAASYRRLSELNSESVPVWWMLGTSLAQLGDRDGAIKAFRRVLEIDPSDRQGANVKLMEMGAEELSEMPPAYVRSLFDHYAATFDTALVEKLGYRGPSVLFEAVRAACQARQKPANFEHAIDLGCGTGLAAVAFAKMVDQFIGIDLSSGMIEKARARGLYAQLKVTDMLEGLRTMPDSGVELVLSADAMLYLADLFPVLNEVSRVLASGGLLAFTLERHDGERFIMGEGRRYAHSASYVRASIEAAGLVVLQIEQQSTRNQKGVPVPGLVIVAEKS
jgi:predicted TPR repeat methyltransferase